VPAPVELWELLRLLPALREADAEPLPLAAALPEPLTEGEPLGLTLPEPERVTEALRE
jgi:hypothetical protein